MALVGYSVVILCCIFVENVIEVEEDSTGKLYLNTLLNAMFASSFIISSWNSQNTIIIYNTKKEQSLRLLIKDQFFFLNHWHTPGIRY